MLKNIIFAAIWLPFAVVLEIPDQDEVDSGLITNLGHNIKTECATFLFRFSIATKQFNMCAVEHAKPLRFCERCASKYTNVVKHNPAEFNDSNCVSDLVTSERFQIVMKVYDFQTELWHAAHCQKCYIHEDSSETWNQTKLTKQFFHQLLLVKQCFKNYSKNGTTKSPLLSEEIANTSLCKGCNYYFDNLGSTYMEIIDHTEQKNEDLMCADIMSAMNDTRKDWKRFDCWKDSERDYTDLLFSFGIFLSTFIFYVGVQKHEKYKMKVYSRRHLIRKEVNYDSE